MSWRRWLELAPNQTRDWLMPRLQKNLATGVCQIEFELDAEEYAAIGRVMAQWAYLEHGLYEMSSGIAEIVGITLPEDARSVSFSRRLRVLRDLVMTHAPDHERKRMIRLLDRIANVEQDRHQVAHGTWDWEPSKPELLRASCLRPSKTFEKLYDAKRINRVADQIGQISFELQYPGGWDEAFVDAISGGDETAESVAYASVSRAFVRLMSQTPKAKGAPKG